MSFLIGILFFLVFCLGFSFAMLIITYREASKK